jgi:CTP synthase
MWFVVITNEGDIESMVYLEALRQLQYGVGADNFCLVHVSLVPTVGASSEQKSKPTQHGVRELRAAGLNPDVIACRSAKPLDRQAVEKISQYSMLSSDHIISIYDVGNIYCVPLMLLEQRVPSLILARLRINKMPPHDVPKWRSLASRFETAERKVTIAIVGKYTGLTDSYLSITHALRHAAIAINVRLEIDWIDSEHLETVPSLPAPIIATLAGASAGHHALVIPPPPRQAFAAAGYEADACKMGVAVRSQEAKAKSASRLEESEAAWVKIYAADGVLVPGGFGDRGVEGMIAATGWARRHKKPFLGICLGMQVAVIEWCRSVLELKDANSTEFNRASPHPVIVEMPEIDQTTMGGTMRLGARRTNIRPDTLAAQLYGGKPWMMERHRHRYEVNPKYVSAIEASGLAFTGVAEKQHANDLAQRMEIAELPASIHPFMFAVQFHPEFKSRPLDPSAPFLGFVKAAAKVLVRDKLLDGKVLDARTSTPLSAALASHSSRAPTMVAPESTDGRTSPPLSVALGSHSSRAPTLVAPESTTARTSGSARDAADADAGAAGASKNVTAAPPAANSPP